MPPKITAVTVSNITGTSATVTWVTDEPASSQVEYGLDSTNGATTALSPTRVYSHTVSIGSLEPGVTYHFRTQSSDVRGNLARSDPGTFDTSLIKTVSEYAYTSGGAKLEGMDGEPIVLLNKPEARDVAWQELMQFLQDDQTDKIRYVDGIFVCGEFAETLHNNAEIAGIRAAFVSVDFQFDSSGHAVNAFQTEDRGLVYIDDTGFDTSIPCKLDKIVDIVKGQSMTPKWIFPCSSYDLKSMGTVSNFKVNW
jgi:hypothetical protein